LFFDNNDEWNVTRDICAKPLFSDHGTGLVAYGQRHQRHWFCFRDLLQHLGSRRSVAILAHRLLFSGTKEEYVRLRDEARISFEVALALGRVTRQGRDLFSATFGFVVVDEQSIVIDGEDPFESEALWGERGQRGVAACPNHVEGLHGRLNAATNFVRLPSRRLKRMIDVCWKKAERHGVQLRLGVDLQQAIQSERVSSCSHLS
jgi:hypothetical protein